MDLRDMASFFVGLACERRVERKMDLRDMASFFVGLACERRVLLLDSPSGRKEQI